ncbi:MAG: hypothetical protein V1674_00550 [Candidatus Omnitrophota bacterium]
MKPAQHIIITLPFSAAIYLYFNSLGSALILFFSGILIDLDHILDYRLNGRYRANLKEFYLFCLEKQFDRIFLIFHSLDVILFLWILITVFKLNIYWIALTVGLSLHIILDLLTNGVYPPAYFLVYRMIKDFKKESMFKE